MKVKLRFRFVFYIKVRGIFKIDFKIYYKFGLRYEKELRKKELFRFKF